MAYKIEFEIRTAIPTLQNTYGSGIFLGLGGGWGGERIKAGRNRVYLKAAADDKIKTIQCGYQIQMDEIERNSKHCFVLSYRCYKI